MSAPRNIDYLLEEIITLPSLPATVARILELLNDPDSSLSEVGKIVSGDPAIALKTLRLVNSAAYGLRGRVTSVEHAVTLLGAKVIQNLVLTATVLDTLSSGARLLFQHSIAAGVAARSIMRSHIFGNVLDPEEAFAYGLLHDIGKIILEDYMSDELVQAEDLSRVQGLPGHVAEREVIGVDHAEIGGRLAMNWRLPDSIAAAIMAHHDLARCKDDEYLPYAAMLNAADTICVAAGLPSYEGAVADDANGAWQVLGITSPQIPAILDDFFASIPEVEELTEAVS
ncbi:MAG TPA: HDOD domain-containing protein [Candidatus Hydrogenedentes bacterium]|nr:HDOD domain-containing protein [Candidatus Hydrogenedentota bacterium]HQE84356.1 HDOD domain-containing protein [Candidatus Hydrogenedentota bacterium]HQH53400.1 HDOD domain-containing protein [Candidatus Hydrogenedentota bacterium]HQM47233.1 HDOD domain-containing protein [Candidatus Hydrogenedentota bacterium]